MRIQLALAESWDVNAGLPELAGYTDKLGPLASLSLGPHAQDAEEMASSAPSNGAADGLSAISEEAEADEADARADAGSGDRLLEIS